MKKIVTDTQRNVFICFPNPDMCIGIIIEKTNTRAVCVGVEDYINKKGEHTKILIWDVTFKPTGEVIKRKSSFRVFRISDIPSTNKPFLSSAL